LGKLDAGGLLAKIGGNTIAGLVIDWTGTAGNRLGL